MRWPEISRLIIRALGVLMAANGAFSLTMQLFTIYRYDFIGRQVGTHGVSYAISMIFYFLPPLVYVIVGLALIIFSEKLVGRFSRVAGSDQAEVNLGAIENILISVVGVYFVADGVSIFARLIFDVSFGLFGRANSASMDPYANLCAVAVKFAIGGFLIVRNNGVATLVQRLRVRVGKARDWPNK